jgi:hypothetical protein
MKFVTVLILLLSQVAMADVTAKKPFRENCTGSACPSRPDSGANQGGANAGDDRMSARPERESPQPSAGAGGEPAGAAYKNQTLKQDKSSPDSHAGAGGQPPGAAYKNRLPTATGSAPR